MAGRTVASVLLPVALLTGGGCGSGWQNTVEVVLDDLAQGQSCGPGQLAGLVPDCPASPACFSFACQEHDACYATCGVSKYSCDTEFYRDTLAACYRSFALDEAALADCRLAAVMYWAAVSLLGEDAFQRAQTHNCPDGPDDLAQADRRACRRANVESTLCPPMPTTTKQPQTAPAAHR